MERNQRRNAGTTAARRRRKRRRRRAGSCLIKLVLAAALFAALFCAVRIGWEYLQEYLRNGVTPQRLEAEGWPESLVELLKKNPEARDFVLGYQDYSGSADPADIDISGEVTQGEIPLFLQWDRRWGYETYGDDFLAVTGCGPTCLSMVLCGLTGDTGWNPLAAARWAQEQGYYVEGSGSSWSLMTEGARSLGLNPSEVIFDEAHILAELEAGHPVICVVGPGDFTTSGHFLVLTGVDDSGNILLNDPNSIVRSQKAWEPEELMSQIRNLWSYTV